MSTAQLTLIQMLLVLGVIGTGCRQNGDPSVNPGATETPTHKVQTVGNTVILLEYVPQSSRSLSEEREGNRSVSFRIRMATRNQGVDVLQAGLHSYSEFSHRIEQWNFDMPELLTLHDGEQSDQAEAVLPDNDYGMTGTRSALVVFPKQLQQVKSANIDISYDDQILGTGIHHFSFAANDLRIASSTDNY